ncbi:type II toxin-antitoxin system RelE/ParE family toxin [Crocosphaera sp. XPORK-15E]|uniref:type II toxin-antitoxin system RelE family toxin n=1 Tax=Crocosphaera sp. XPORK-15E TaxID=3110247 RepID=UPI002B1F11FD|nr:type II toxin-antitoxin system RelE/ParE family toxin [Crocosphaera sp. XPORK-15E]MEA5533201.1 type II toxin-antitoxin system RelE/ParE family toxin [Crocosphaera sp. XPORK-15E]
MSKEYSFIIEYSARKSLKNLQPKFIKQIVFKIFTLQDNPFPQDCKKLKGYEKGYRVDQGEYRILYTVEDDKIRVFKIGKRNDGEVYRNL